MNPILTLLTALLLAPRALPGFACSASAQETLEGYRAAARGFGDVLRIYRQSEQQGSWTTFQAEDAVHARIVGSKRLADLLGFGDLKRVSDRRFPGTVLELDGAGCWLLGVENDRFHELFAPNQRELGELAKSAGAWAAVPERAYPRWLDCFDTAGPGIWPALAGLLRQRRAGHLVGRRRRAGGHSFRVPVDEGARAGVQLPPAQ